MLFCYFKWWHRNSLKLVISNISSRQFQTKHFKIQTFTFHWYCIPISGCKTCECDTAGTIGKVIPRGACVLDHSPDILVLGVNLCMRILSKWCASRSCINKLHKYPHHYITECTKIHSDTLISIRLFECKSHISANQRLGLYAIVYGSIL